MDTAAKTSGKVLIVDDEPQNIYWIAEYLESLGLKVCMASNLNDALARLNQETFSFLIIDLNIPATEPLDVDLRKEGGVFGKFPGLYAARYARNKGYSGSSTVLYSVHQDKEVLEWADRLNCGYLSKGRPKAFKEALTAAIKLIEKKQKQNKS